VKSLKDAAASELAEARVDERKQSIAVDQSANELTPTRSPPGKRAKKSNSSRISKKGEPTTIQENNILLQENSKGLPPPTVNIAQVEALKEVRYQYEPREDSNAVPYYRRGVVEENYRVHEYDDQRYDEEPRRQQQLGGYPVQPPSNREERGYERAPREKSPVYRGYYTVSEGGSHRNDSFDKQYGEPRRQQQLGGYPVQPPSNREDRGYERAPRVEPSIHRGDYIGMEPSRRIYDYNNQQYYDENKHY